MRKEGAPRLSRGRAGGSQALVPGARGVGMDSLRELLEAVREHDLARGQFQGLLHIIVGRRISREDGTLISSGTTWRDLAALFKRLRWDREVVRELGINPSELAPRDRERFWYSAIARAAIDSPDAVADAEHLIEPLADMGYVVGPAPGTK